jgi:hypothetical protein
MQKKEISSRISKGRRARGALNSNLQGNAITISFKKHT